MDFSKITPHLFELRSRLLICATAFIIAVIVGYLLAADIFQILVLPLSDAMGQGANRIIFTGLMEAFTSYLRIAFFFALFIAFPLIIYHTYSFLSPALYAKEKRIIRLFAIIFPFMFYLGGFLAYAVIFPMAFEFFLSFEVQQVGNMPALELEAKISEYLSLIMQIMIAFGFAFQLPVILLLLIMVGMVSAENLVKFRKYNLIIVFVIAAFLTPPDIISQIILAIPLLIFYELIIIYAKFARKKPT
jgi:sec-independent protein translocase protein TatC